MRIRSPIQPGIRTSHLSTWRRLRKRQPGPRVTLLDGTRPRGSPHVDEGARELVGGATIARFYERSAVVRSLLPGRYQI